MSRFIGRSRASYLICALGMVLRVGVRALHRRVLAVRRQPTSYSSYEDVGWVAGPVGILFFGYCFSVGLSAKTDGEGRVLTPEGKPLGEE